MMRKMPLSAVVVSRRRPVEGLVTVTFAPTICAPFWSRIVPTIPPCVVCAKTSLASSTTVKTTIRFNGNVHICHPLVEIPQLKSIPQVHFALNAVERLRLVLRSRSCRRRHLSSQTEHVRAGEYHLTDHLSPRPCRQTCLHE